MSCMNYTQNQIITTNQNKKKMLNQYISRNTCIAPQHTVQSIELNIYQNSRSQHQKLFKAFQLFHQKI